MNASVYTAGSPAPLDLARVGLSDLWIYRPALPVRAYTAGMAFERITTNPARMQGLPCIRDTRVTVSAILGQLAAGQSIEQILADYPQLARADVLAALEYAAAIAREREIPLPTAG